MLNLKAKIPFFVSLFFVITLLMVNPSMASPVAGLYDVEILVKDEGADQRWGAFVKGLDEVFVRIAGDSIVMDKLKRPAPTAYVKRYSYEPVDPPETDEKGDALTHRIKIQYNSSLMEKYLKDNGFAVWGEHRPQVIIWLAVRDGRNEYVLKAADQSLLKSTTDLAMARRGVPQRWPVYDAKDRKALSIADIRGGFQDQVIAASKRYTRGPALTGSLIWNGSQWQSNWSLLMASGNRHWNLAGAEYEQLINKAVDQAADMLGSVFAVHESMKDDELVAVRLDIAAVTSVERYSQVEEYLRDISIVSSVVPLTVDGSSVMFELKLRSNEEDLLNILKNDAELVKVEVSSVPDEEAFDIQELMQTSGEARLPGEAQRPDSSDAQPDTGLNAAPAGNKVSLYHYRLSN